MQNAEQARLRIAADEAAQSLPSWTYRDAEFMERMAAMEEAGRIGGEVGRRVVDARVPAFGRRPLEHEPQLIDAAHLPQHARRRRRRHRRLWRLRGVDRRRTLHISAAVWI